MGLYYYHIYTHHSVSDIISCKVAPGGDKFLILAVEAIYLNGYTIQHSALIKKINSICDAREEK